MKYLVLVFFVASLAACTLKMNYLPQEYEITNNRIVDFEVNGELQIINSQSDASEKHIGDSGGVEMFGDYQSVTEQLRVQLEKEINENSKRLDSDLVKTIDVRVVDLWAELKAFRFVSTMQVNYQLGNGETGTVDISHGTPGNMYRAYNGSIAWGVIKLLEEEKIITYLGGDTADPVQPLDTASVDGVAVVTTGLAASASQSGKAIDLTGIYKSEITYTNSAVGVTSQSYKWYFGNSPRIKIFMEQEGNSVTGKLRGDRKGVVRGTITGNLVEYEFDIEVPGDSVKFGNGTWQISDDGKSLDGGWKSYGGSLGGEWNLDKTD